MSTRSHVTILHEYLDALEARLHRRGEYAGIHSLRDVHETARKGLDVAARLLAATDLLEDREMDHQRLQGRVAELRALVESKASHF